jgi:hypothetical protein
MRESVRDSGSDLLRGKHAVRSPLDRQPIGNRSMSLGDLGDRGLMSLRLLHRRTLLSETEPTARNPERLPSLFVTTDSAQRAHL